MRPDKFIFFIQNPEKLNTATASRFRKLAEEYPYCQPLRFVLAKNLQVFKSTDYELHVNQAAAMSANRRAFQAYIAGRDSTSTKESQTKKASNEKSLGWFGWITALLGLRNKEETPAIVAPTKIPDTPVLEAPSQVAETVDVIEIPAEQVESSAPKKSKQNFNHLIDKFITENPSIGSYNPTITGGNLAEKNLVEPEEIGTETLATVFERQGHTGKAIAIYEKLSLKYPEKSSYFAEKISSLKNHLTN